MTPEEFKHQLDELCAIITAGVAYFTAWRGLMVGDEESAKALNRYRSLFLPARNALLWMTLMQFAKVFDRDARTVSLGNLLSAATQDRHHLAPHATQEDLDKLKQQMEENHALLKRLKRQRDQRIAHHDATASGDRSLLYGDMRRLVDDVKCMYNALNGAHNRTYTWFDYLTREVERHTSEVVRIMREEERRRDRAIRRIRDASAT